MGHLGRIDIFTVLGLYYDIYSDLLLSTSMGFLSSVLWSPAFILLRNTCIIM